MSADGALRGEKRLADLELQAGDELVTEGLRADILKIKDTEGLDFKADVYLADPEDEKGKTTIVQGVLLLRSLCDRTHFRASCCAPGAAKRHALPSAERV
jgi:hypothetical protein